jgi:hypothetical protein
MVRRSRAPLLAASLIACGLAGCSSVTPVATNVDTPGMPNAEVALQKSMDETAGELARIGAVQPVAAVASKPTIVPGELERVVAMSWNGALDGAVKKLADTIGYRAAVSGNAPRAVSSSIRLPSGSTTFFMVSATRPATPRRSGWIRSISSSR